MSMEGINETFFIFMLSSTRLLTIGMMMAFLSTQTLGSAMIRNGVLVSLALILYPVVEQHFSLSDYNAWNIFLIASKEALIGIVMGFVLNIPFWAAESAGFLMDNQRGATMASSLNPLSGSDTSPLGILFSQTLIVVFFVSGTFLIMLHGIYKSYQIWPVFEFLPTLREEGLEFFLAQMDTLMRLTLLLGAPVVVAMFLTEFGLALVSRFAPELNVFILAMPIKSAVGIAVLIVYVTLIIQYFADYLRDIDSITKPIIKLIS